MQYYVELLNSLKRGVVSPVYLFYGEETYLREQGIQRFREFFSPEGDSDLNCELVDGEDITPAEVVTLAKTVPFLGDKRLLVVQNPGFLKASPTSTGTKEKAAAEKKTTAAEKKKAAKEEKASSQEQVLLDYLENPNTSTCLIFTTSAPVDRRKKLFRSLKKNGRVVEFTFLKRGDLRRWLAKRAAESGKKLQAQGAEALLDSVGLSMLKLDAEIEKLCAFTGEWEEITAADVAQLVTPTIEENIFAIVDAIGLRRCGEALRGIRDLLAAKEPPMRLLAMISRQFRILLQISDLASRGNTSRDICSTLKLHPFVYERMATQKNNFSLRQLADALTAITELETAVKNGSREFYPALETYLLKLSIER